MSLTRQQAREQGRADYLRKVNAHAYGPRRERRKLARALEKKNWRARDKKQFNDIKQAQENRERVVIQIAHQRKLDEERREFLHSIFVLRCN